MIEKINISDASIVNEIANVISRENLLPTLKGYYIPNNMTVDNFTAPGAWVLSGDKTNGLSSYSGVLLNFGDGYTICQLLLTKNCMAFRRSDGSWYKNTFTVVE